MSDPKRMLSDPELGDLLRADLDVSAKHSIEYDVDKGLARHVALIAGGAAAATATVTATASASSLSTATATTAATATATTATTATATTAATGVAAGLGVKTMIAVAAIGVATATGGVIAVTSSPEPKPAAVTASQPSPVQKTDKASSPSRAKATQFPEQNIIPQTDMPVLEPTITPDQLPIAQPDKVAPATVSPTAEMDNYVKARGLAQTDTAGALALLDDGNKRFPRGVFVEEREALAIDCLVRLGRTAEAKQRAQAFLDTHPTSVFAEKIRQQTDSH